MSQRLIQESTPPAPPPHLLETGDLPCLHCPGVWGAMGERYWKLRRVHESHGQNCWDLTKHSCHLTPLFFDRESMSQGEAHLLRI